MPHPEPATPQSHAPGQPPQDPSPQQQEPEAPGQPPLPPDESQKPAASADSSGPSGCRCLGWAAVIAAAVVFCFMAYGVSVLQQAARPRIKITDGRPDGFLLSGLTAKGWPSSIDRILEAHSSIGIHGDGTSVDIYCFAPGDVQRVKDLIGKGRPWQPGYRSGWELRDFKGRMPADVYFDETTPAGDYIHLEDPDNPLRMHLINTTRGIYYGILSRT
ncbi:MAG: hypothetical protein NTY98_02725 [Verrucomicrobia bacterium]|nr:hypothetical protein [Verrucomicrobiota bacterium]